MSPWFSNSVPAMSMGLLPSKVSVRENPSRIAATLVAALNVDPAMPPATAQLIWESR